METFYIYTPKATGNRSPDKIEILLSFIKYGKENAIKREDLTKKCVEAGIITSNCEKNREQNQDRAMRKLLAKAKIDYNISITNDGDGKGYYRPTKSDLKLLSRNNNTSKKKAISSFVGNKVNVAMEDDFRHGRKEE